jgi:hypothetical protein
MIRASLLSLALLGGPAVLVSGAVAAPAYADGICPAGHAESGLVGGLMACVHLKTGKTIFVEA